MLTEISHNKVQVSRTGVLAFNQTWPCSKLRSERTYWFEFDDNQDLIDSDIPEQDDGDAALALSQDCQAWLFDLVSPQWLIIE